MDYIKIALLVILIGVIMVDILKNGQACKIFSKYIYRIYILLKSKIIICIEHIIIFLSKINNNLISVSESEYESLTPKADLDRENSYIQALKESIEDCKRKNIAIAGIYGAGKSSIIESFKRNYKEYRYLDISLATFTVNGNDPLEDQLERNILNQIFYKVEHKKMPYSRFRKINNIKKLDILRIIAIIVLLIITSTLLIKPTVIETFNQNSSYLQEYFTKIPILKYNTNISMYIIIAISAITMLYVASVFIKILLSKFTINSIQNKDGNIQVGKRQKEESFNQYLDEIMYFFEVFKYNVIFFEDLDRFNNVEIFTKLRELNKLINSSESINRKVTFVYAIKDELFFVDKNSVNEFVSIDNKENNKNRTKFFDFIIPVIPIVNSENSYDLLKRKIDEFNTIYREEKEKVSDELISDISFFIDDMRLLTNIYNEFKIYYKRIIIEGKCESLNVNNLLAMIVYKNLYPVDFTMLLRQQGMVYNVFNKKAENVDSIMQELYIELEQYKSNIEQLKKEIVENEEELKLIYLDEWKKSNIRGVKIDDTEYGISSLIDFEVIMKAKNATRIYQNMYYSWQEISFENLDTINGKKTSYSKRITAIKSIGENIKDKINYNKKEIEKLDKKINEFKSSSIERLMKDSRFVSNLDEDIKAQQLIIRLLKFGYINESYSSYILYFYEGRFTKKDFEYIQGVIQNKPLRYDTDLTNTKEILGRLRIEDFESVSILNYNLLQYLLENIDSSNNKLKLEKIIELLSEFNDEYLNFIFKFIELNNKSGISKFIRLLCNTTDKFWNAVFWSSSITCEQRDSILKLIFNNCDINEIVLLNSKGTMKEYIESKEDFIRTIAWECYSHNFGEKCLNLNIKIKYIDEETFEMICDPKDNVCNKIIKYLYLNNLYEINEQMLRVIIAIEKNLLNDLENINLNYSSIKSYELEELKNYIDDNINIYIQNIFNYSDISEDSNTIIELINNENIEDNLIRNIIKQKEFIISNINNIKDSNFWGDVLKNLKVSFSWRNIFEYYKNRDKVDEVLAGFVNKKEVYEKLKEDELYENDFSEKQIREIDGFVEEFIKSEMVSDIVINLVACKLREPFIDFDFNGLSIERVNILINNELVTVTEEVYKALKSSHFGMHITLVESNINKFINTKIECFDTKDLVLVIESQKITNVDKFKILQEYSENIKIDESIAALIFNSIEDILVKEELKYAMIKEMIEYLPNKESKIKLLIYQIKNIDKENIVELLEKIDSEYTGLLEFSSKKMRISGNYENELILKALKDNGYISSFKREKANLAVYRKQK